MRKPLLVLLVLTCIARYSWAQSDWRPYIAKYRSSDTTTDLAGNIIRQTQVTGTEMRARDGSTTLLHDANPTGTFRDASSGKAYSTSYSQRRATLKGVAPITHVVRELKSSPIGSAVVNGIHCVSHPVREGSATGPIVGTWCVSPESDLIVKEDIAIEPAALARRGFKRIVTVERYNVQMDVDPPPSQFGIPEGFEVDTGVLGRHEPAEQGGDSNSAIGGARKMSHNDRVSHFR